MVSYLVILLCFLTLILIPLAIYLYTRWAVATPAAVVEDLRVGAAGKRSAELTRKRRWRALAIMLGSMLIAGLPGPLVGAVLLLVTSFSFSLVNVVVIVISAVAIVAAAIVVTLHYYDLRNRTQSREPDTEAQEAVV